MSLTLLLCFGNQHFKAPCSILAKSEQHRILLQVIGILTTAFSVILHGLLHLRLLQHHTCLYSFFYFASECGRPGNARSFDELCPANSYHVKTFDQEKIDMSLGDLLTDLKECKEQD